MYIGSTDAAGCSTACGRSSTTRSTRRWPVTARRIEVVLRHADGSAEVRDNGPRNPRRRSSRRPSSPGGLELVMTGCMRAVSSGTAPTRFRRPARGRRLGGQRPDLPAATSRWTGTAAPGRPASAAASPGSSPTTASPVPGRASPGAAACARSVGSRRRSLAPTHPVLARSPGLRPRRPVQLHRHHRARPPERPTSYPAWPSTSATEAPRARRPGEAPGRRARGSWPNVPWDGADSAAGPAAGPARRSSASTAASASSAST